jgi:hypothetical protein
MKQPKIIELDSAGSVKCPICGHVIIPENGEEVELSSSDMCEHVVGVEFGGELQESYGRPETEQWWSEQQGRFDSDTDVEIEEPSLRHFPLAQFIVIYGDGSGDSTLAFGLPQNS